MCSGEDHRDQINVLLVDDQKLFVESLQYVINSRAPDIRVVEVVFDGTEALDCTEKYRPDIILMDIRMPGMDGVKATAAIHKTYPEIKIVILTTFPDDEYVKSAMEHGAFGYLLKNIPPDELIESIRAVHGGIMQLSPSICRVFFGSNMSANSEEEESVLLEPLTRQEKEVLRLIVESHDNKEIARYLYVAEQTARNYVHHLYSKFGVSSRPQLLKILHKHEEFMRKKQQ